MFRRRNGPIDPFGSSPSAVVTGAPQTHKNDNGQTIQHDSDPSEKKVVTMNLTINIFVLKVLLVVVLCLAVWSSLAGMRVVTSSSSTTTRLQASLDSPAGKTTSSLTSSFDMVDYFANNGYAKAFDTMQYPMGLYDASQDTTYVVYQGPHEDPYIVSYHHASKQWIGPIQAGVSLLGHETDPVQMHDGRVTSKSLARLGLGGAEAHTRFSADNHGKPAIVIDDNGYIHISFGAHGGDPELKKKLGRNQFGDYSGGRQTHVRSKRPYDIREWEVMENSKLSWNGCYAQFVKIGSHIYHFVRHGAHVSCWTYQRSIDQGETWESVQPILKTKQQEKERVKDSWYCRFRPGTGDRDHMLLAVCVYHKHWMPPNHNLEAHNGYYLELDTRTQKWYNVKGEELTDMPLTKERADELVQVFDTEHSDVFTFHYVHPGSVALDNDGRPHLLYKISVDGEVEGLRVGRGRKKMFYVKWNGSHWTEPISVSGPDGAEFDEDGDIEFLESGSRLEVVFAVSNKTHSTVASFVSNDTGQSWNPGQPLMTLKGPGKFRTSAFVANGRPDARIAAYLLEPNQRQIGAYRKCYLIGNDGAIRRPIRQADVCHGELVGEKGSLCVPNDNYEDMNFGENVVAS